MAYSPPFEGGVGVVISEIQITNKLSVTFIVLSVIYDMHHKKTCFTILLTF